MKSAEGRVFFPLGFEVGASFLGGIEERERHAGAQERVRGAVQHRPEDAHGNEDTRSRVVMEGGPIH